MIGVFVRGSIFARCSPAGRLLSRAIANIIRIAAVWTARQQTVIAITTRPQEQIADRVAEDVEDDVLQPAGADLRAS